jgi:hypothetical protein
MISDVGEPLETPVEARIGRVNRFPHGEVFQDKERRVWRTAGCALT